MVTSKHLWLITRTWNSSRSITLINSRLRICSHSRSSKWLSTLLMSAIVRRNDYCQPHRTQTQLPLGLIARVTSSSRVFSCVEQKRAIIPQRSTTLSLSPSQSDRRCKTARLNQQPASSYLRQFKAQIHSRNPISYQTNTKVSRKLHNKKTPQSSLNSPFRSNKNPRKPQSNLQCFLRL